jgi:hypothetical protein
VEVQSPQERSIVASKIIEMAQAARRTALGASDRELAVQAEALIQEVENQP